jgi:uncharacterized membrane protein
MNNNTENPKATTEGTAKLVYILYLVSILFGITSIVGLIIAYVNKDDAPTWLQSHYQFQIRTFWIGALYLLIGLMLYQVIIGFFIIMFWVIWLIVRCAKGMKSLDRGDAHPDPAGWLF